MPVDHGACARPVRVVSGLGVEPLRGPEKLRIGGRPARQWRVADVDRSYGSGAPDDLPSEGMVRIRADHLQRLVGVVDRLAGRPPADPVVSAAGRCGLDGISVRAVVRPPCRGGHRGDVPQVQAQRSPGAAVWESRSVRPDFENLDRGEDSGRSIGARPRSPHRQRADCPADPESGGTPCQARHDVAAKRWNFPCASGTSRTPPV